MDAGQEELIQRAIGVINPRGVGNFKAQIDVRPDREEIVQEIFTRIEKEEPAIEIAELGDAQPKVHFDLQPRAPATSPRRQAIIVNMDTMGTFGPPHSGTISE